MQRTETNALYRYRLYSPECDNVGVFMSPAANWSRDATFTLRDGRRFQIMKIVPFPVAALYDAMWMVEQIQDHGD